MHKLFTSLNRQQSSGEETANAISHGSGFIAALVGTPFLIMQAIRQGEAAFVVGVIVFSMTMILLYLGSTLYHALPAGKANLEHAAASEANLM